MARNTLDLSSVTWRFGQAPRQPFSPVPRDDRASVAEWLPARVPGDLRADLLEAGRIASLDTPEGITRSEWVDDADWWYRTEIQAAEPGSTMILEADGIDYLSGIWLDDRLLATHEGMFARQAIVLPDTMQEPGSYELAMRIWGAGALPRLPNSGFRRAVRQLLKSLGLATEYFPDRMATTKAQFGFGWDFAPRVLSTGIWDGVRLVACRGAYLRDVRVEAEPLGQGEDPTPVRWQVHLRVTRFEDATLRAQVELLDAHGRRVRLSQDTFDVSGVTDQLLTFDSASVARWWPWDQGEPALQRLIVRLLDGCGPVDEVEVLTGVRTVRREPFPDGQPWRFVINDRPVFLRGANWVPADVLPGRVSPEDYEKLIGQARAAGINFLRVWGGGIREKRAFWDQCNRVGIMTMQEFPLACAFLDHYPRDRRYLSVLESEAQGMVRSLRNEPSLLAWCGGNEISPQRERLPLRTIERVLGREDPARPWIPASPSQGDAHFWDVWHGGAPWRSFSRVTAAFMSEFGMQALPRPETVGEMFASGVPSSLDDPRWAERKADSTKLRYYAGPMDENDAVATIEATQRSQAAGLQAGIEACRLRREGSGNRYPCGGLALWQFNEPWLAVSWSVIDRKGQPKEAYDMLLRAYQPVLVAAKFQWRDWQAGEKFTAEIWLVNDRAEMLDSATVEASLDGQRVHLCDEVLVSSASARRVGWLAADLERKPTCLELSCSRKGALVATNRYDLAVYLPLRQPLVSRLIRAVAGLLLKLG